MTDQPDWMTPSGGQQPQPAERISPSATPPGATPPGAMPPAAWGPFPQSSGQQPYGQQQGQPTYGPTWTPPVKPGVIPLRPLGVGEVLDGAIATLRSHPLVTMGLSALVAVATEVVILPLSWLLLRDLGDQTFDTGGSGSGQTDLTLAAGTILVLAVKVVVTLVATLVLTGILTVVVSRAVLGEPVSAAEAWSRARPRLPALFGVTLLIFLAAGAALMAGVLPSIALAAAGGPVLAVAVAVVLLPALSAVAIYLFVAFALAPASVVLERAGIVASLRRSRALVKGAWWRTFGILLLVNVIAGFVSGVLSVPFQVGSYFAAFLAKGGGDLDTTAFVPMLIVSLGTIVGSAVTWPFTAAATLLVYVDRRIRREGLDLELMRAAGMNPAGQSATPGVAPQQSYGDGPPPPYGG